MSRDYRNRGLENGLKVLDFLCTGDILAWKTIPEVMAATKLSQAVVHSCLHTLKDFGFVTQGDKGFRAAPEGLIQYALEAQEALLRYGKQLMGAAGPAREGSGNKK